MVKTGNTRRWSHRFLASVPLGICLSFVVLACSQRSTQVSERASVKPEQTPRDKSSSATWHFAVSGDSRNCGDVVMPAIAADASKHDPKFYLHLGDFRAIYKVDEDMEHKPGHHAGPVKTLEYELSAWDDFLEHQVHPFGSIPVYLGIGNHETIISIERKHYITKFKEWLDAPVLRDQRLKDDPSDHDPHTYYHWTIGGVDFLYMDNASPNEFDDVQMKWFEGVLARDSSDPAIQTVVVGMHAALPDSISESHSMSKREGGFPNPHGERTGRRAYQDLLKAENESHKHVYVLASHSHFYMEGIYNTDYWQKNGGVLPGWIIGTAGAVRYRLPPNSGNAREAKTDVYGYLLATVNPEGATDGTIRFEFHELQKADIPAGVVDRVTPQVVNWCFEENKQ